MSLKQTTQEMTVREHLSELKRRMLVCLFSFLAGFGAVFSASSKLMESIVGEASGYGYTVMIAAPAEGMIWRFKLSAYAALGIALPVICWHILSFVTEAKRIREKAAVAVKTAFVSALMLLGGTAGRKLMVPFALKFLEETASGIDGLAVTVTVKDYMRLYLCGIGCSALTALLPVLLCALSGAGVVTYSGMKAKRPYYVVAAFIAAAVITPPDVVTQIIAGTMLVLFYQVGLLAVKRSERKRKVSG